jgi:tripartite-type tricarboxylate transporter receptor subunit TctC
MKNILMFLWAGLLATAAHAQSFPSQPIKIIVPFAPGGGVDIVGRTIAEGVTRTSGHAVVVENRTGAGGNVGSGAVAKAPADGYTLLIASNSTSYNNFLYSNMPYDAVRDLQAIVQIARVPMVLLVSPTIAPRNVAEVVALAKAKPGALNFGSGGNGTSEHLVYELFKRRAGIDAQHIPYRGGAQVYTDLIGGQVQLFFNNQLGAMQYVRSGQLRAAGITSQKRSAQLPDVPTFEEQGIGDFNASVWWGVMGPAGMPKPVVEQLNQIVNAAIASPDVTRRLESQGAQPAGGSAEQFAAFFASERKIWQSVIKDAGIKLE